MEVGVYVRTDNGEIGKLEDLKLNYTTGKRLVTNYTYKEVKENLIRFDNKNITQRFVNGSCLYLTDDELKNVEDSIIKSSPNIIDLIEVGDVLSFNDGSICRIIEISDNGYYLLKDYGGEQYYERKEYIDTLISIVTREQFSQMEYKVGD